MAFPKIDGYVVTEKLGSGSYSTVYKAYTKVGARTTVAIKCVERAQLKKCCSSIDNLVTEIRLLKQLKHPHCVLMHNFTWDEKYIYIIMEYCSGGDLSKYIHRYGRVPEKQVLYFLQQLASALKFLREKNVVHMDLKPHNLLLHKDDDGKYILKVADFGFAQHMTSESLSCGIRGSPLYMAPEMLTQDPGTKVDASVDLWSVGVIMFECLFGRAPYSSRSLKELLEKVRTKAPILIPRSPAVTPRCSELLSRLLQHDPRQRITYEEFFSNEYLDLEHMPTKENYDKAVLLLKQAVQADAFGDLRGAFELYCSGARYLVRFVTSHGDAARRAALASKLDTYLSRAEEIKQLLKQSENSALPQIPASPSNASSPKNHRQSSDSSSHRQASDRHRQESGNQGYTCCSNGRSGEESNSFDFGTQNQTQVNPRAQTCAFRINSDGSAPNAPRASADGQTDGRTAGRTHGPQAETGCEPRPDKQSSAQIGQRLHNLKQRIFGKRTISVEEPYAAGVVDSDSKDNGADDKMADDKMADSKMADSKMADNKIADDKMADDTNDACRIT